MRIVLDSAILVRATEGSKGLARELLLRITRSQHRLVLSNEVLFEVARVLRYPRLPTIHGLTDERIYDYTCFLRERSQIVIVNPLLPAPIRDINDIVVVQTAIAGNADVLCTTDSDFFDPVILRFLSGFGIAVTDDVTLMHRLRA